MANLTPLLTLLPLPNPPVFPYLPASEQPAQRLMEPQGVGHGSPNWKPRFAR